MRVSVLIMTSLLLGLAAGEALERQDKQAMNNEAPVKPNDPVPKRKDRLLLPGDHNRRQERIFAYSTTTSIKRLATTTITAISTCLSTIAPAGPGTPPACVGRRKRSLFHNLANLGKYTDTFPSPNQLDGSQIEVEELLNPDFEPRQRIAREVENPRDGHKLTIWSSFVSTLTVTSTSYLAGTTITATALCVGPGVAAGCFGK